MLVMIIAWGVAEVTTPRYVGHQAREIFTHAIVTLPLLVGLTGGALQSVRRALDPLVVVGLAVAASICVWLGWSVLQVDILSHGANPGLPAGVNLAVHNWEHLIDLALLMMMTRGAARVANGRQPVVAESDRSA